MVSEPIPFLANIALVAFVDGSISSSELGQIEAIRKELKIKKSDFNSALKLVEQNNHHLMLVGTFADQVKNLELMLRVAYADDDLEPKEASLIVSFCKLINITQVQLNKIKKEVLSNLKECGRLCPKCKISLDASAKFCKECGLEFAEPVIEKNIEFDIPKSGLAIEFADSSAASFQNALKIAKSLNGFKSCLKNKKNWYLASYKSGDLNESLELVEALSGIRNKNVYVDGKKEVWNEVFGFSWCATQRATAYRPDEYCFGKEDNRLNPWGCKQARMEWTDWANWFEFGSWEKKGISKKKNYWKFDKEKIGHELRSNLFRFRFCPHISYEILEESIRQLPEIIEPEAENDWDYNRDYEQTPGAIKIVLKEKEDGYVYTDEYWARGVRPKGLKGLEMLLKKVFLKLGLDKNKVEKLLK
ncbi:MAG: zinc ribbon domain-containing protein [Candidatus Nitronauta litoralis]|uniref:Zinc ribbon domain-containing protein n=1 Tax=Candidatus Nitronauta litoralis TaxID=2705533 RepID=A0A7T0BTW7_9BACT|nr:MAG: zinc ribbon domain-containing protein [Candidatus Nitronauta litoralis]